MSSNDKSEKAPEIATEEKVSKPETVEGKTVEEPAANPEDILDATEVPTEDTDETEGLAEEEEVADLKDKLLRALADMENLRRRAQKDREDALKYSATNFARDMLSVADNLRRAIEVVPEGGAPDDAALIGFIEGIALTEKELLSTLERHGIQKIEPTGEKFDPQFHEAMFEIPDANEESGTVMQVIEVGYVIHDRLLRPAKVGIAKTGPASTTTDNETKTPA
ncbi:MAG: nucleotide exchange factor GrpE [Pseudomonadota bacterium]|nr:nucleotide exchange factor GrpE [Pseudomonadota bacterium]